MVYSTQANANPSAFWLLYQILLLPAEMRARLEAEVAPAFDPTTNRLVDLDHLVYKTPLLNSIYWEVLRNTAGSISVREVEEDTMIGGYRLCKGGMVMLPLRLTHYNEDIWGDDVYEFVPDRFIRDISGLPGNKKSPGINTLKPFGGGTSLCPGRHFAINEILAFVATAMRRFDMEVVEGQKVAVPRTNAPSIGTLPPDRDVQVRFRMRHFD
jgi:cytochrome P450